MHYRKSNKPKFVLMLVALLALFAVSIGFTYSWIEGGATFTIQSDDVNEPIKTDTVPSSVTYSGKITLNPSSGNTISLVKYDENTNQYQNLYFSPVSSADGENFLFPVSNTDGTTAFYRKANINDVGTKYINYDFDIADTTKKCYVAFNGKPTITAMRGSTVLDASAFRIMIKCGEVKHFFTTADTNKTSTVATGTGATTASLEAVPFTAYLYNVNKSNKLFTFAKGDKGTIEVSVWLDDGSDTSALEGCEITIDISLIVVQEDVNATFKALTFDKTGTKVSNGYTGGYIRYSSEDHTADFTVSGTSFKATASANSGYDFMGWYSDEACTKLITSELVLSEQTPDDDVTYYAKFQERNATTIYVEPRASYTSYSIYAYGANEYKRADGSTRIVVDKSSFNHDKPYLHIFDDNGDPIKSWPGTQLTNKNSDGNYYLDLPASTFTEGMNYYVIVHDNGNNRIPTDSAKEYIYNLHIGYEQIFKSDKIHLGEGTATHFTDDYPGTVTTLDGDTSYYKMSFTTTEIGEFFAILTDGDKNIYPGSGLPGVKGDIGGTYLFTADNTLIEFDPADMITVNAYGSNGGSGTVNNTSSVITRQGKTIALKATPNTNYKFVGWYKDSSFTTPIDKNSTTASQNITLTAADAGKTLNYYAKFEKLPTVTLETSVKPTAGGKAYVNSNTTLSDVLVGSSVKLSATANSGYRFAGWYTNSACTTTTGITNPTSATSATYTVSGTDGATITLYAKFIKTYTVSAVAGTGGTVTVDKSTVDTGGSAKFTATANSGYEFIGWFTSETATTAKSTNNPYTLTNITANTTLYARFEKTANILYVGVIEYQKSNINQVYYWCDDNTNGTINLSSLTYTTDTYSLGSSYWSNTAQKFYIYEIEVPDNVTGIKFKNSSGSWFGNDVKNFENGKIDLIFEWSGVYHNQRKTK